LNMFTSLTSLEKLFLDGNDLTEIAYDDIKHSLPKLTEISLSDNNWNCSYLTAVIRKMNSVQVKIKIDATKFVSNTTNQKGIACNNAKAVHWKTLNDIHSIGEQLNKLTLQRQQLNNVLSQKMCELNFNVDRNAKSVERLEAMLKLANIDNGNNNNNCKNYQQFHSNDGTLTNAKTGNGAGQISVWTVLLVVAVAMAIAIVIGGFQAITYLRRRRRRAMAFSNRTSTVTMEQSI
jgi:hypothetical protein